MLLLTGEYELRLDEKNRLSIPVRVREQISQDKYGSGFFQILGVNRILSLYPERYYQSIALAVAPRKVAPDESLAFDRINYALAGRVELDRQGRVLLSEKAIRRSGLKEQVTLIGVRDHLEIWNSEQWEKYSQAHLEAHERMLLEAHEQMLQRAREEAMRQERELTGW